MPTSLRALNHLTHSDPGGLRAGSEAKFVDITDRGNTPDHAEGDPRPAAVTFVTTEHFTLQGARSSTISESTGRASVFLGAVSGGLIALGLVATAARIGAAFYTFGLVILPTLAFVGLATFHRVLQTGTRTLPTRAVSRSSATITSITPPSWPATCSTPRNGCPPRDLGSACGSNS